METISEMFCKNFKNSNELKEYEQALSLVYSRCESRCYFMKNRAKLKENPESCEDEVIKMFLNKERALFEKYIDPLNSIVATTLYSIENQISNHYKIEHQEIVDLANGLIGDCLLLRNQLYFSIISELEFEERREFLIKKIVEKINNSNLRVGLFDGLAGILYGLYILCDGKIEKFENLHESLVKYLKDNPMVITNESIMPQIDLISGISGVVFYFLQCSEEQEVIHSLINEIFKHVEIMVASYPNIDEIYLLDGMEFGLYFDLGIAHGVCGLLKVLTMFAEKYGLSECQLKIYKKLVFFIEKTTVNLEHGEFYWNDFLLSGIKNNIINLSWCKGMVGITDVLVKAYGFLQFESKKKMVVKNFCKIIKDYYEDINKDSKILCHGLASIIYEYLLLTNFQDTSFDLLTKFESLEDMPSGFLYGSTGIKLVEYSCKFKKRFIGDLCMFM